MRNHLGQPKRAECRTAGLDYRGFVASKISLASRCASQTRIEVPSGSPMFNSGLSCGGSGFMLVTASL